MSLSQDQFNQLAAPFPASVIKSFVGKGGKEMRYIDVEVLEDRVREVDPNFGKDVVPGAKSVAVHYTIHGVRRGDLFDNDDESNKYGAPQVNAFARACRRALKSFGVGAELWEEGATPAAQAQRPAQQQISRPAQSAQSSGGSGGPSQKQMEWLTGKKFQVPESVARQLSGGRGGQASLMIDAMKRYSDEDDFEKNRAGYIKQALEDVGAGHIQMVSAVKSSSRSYPDYEDDEDLD